MRLTLAGLCLTVLLCPAVLLSSPSQAFADGPLEGDWRTGPMRISVEVQSWGGDCGPRPASTTVPGGRTVHVTQAGDDLSFGGRPARSTTGCWSENVAVRRVSRSFEGGTWRITCRTPPDDPRAETGQYTLRAVGTERIEFRDESRYDWQLNESRCQATMTSTQIFERVGGAATEPPPPPPPPVETPEPACTPGAPARIAMRTPEAEIEPGGRVCLSVRVVDAAGCAVRSARPSLALESPAGRSATLRGTCFEAAASAAAGEGVFTVVASSGALRARERIVVRTPDLSDLIARRAEGGGAVPRDEASAEAEAAARVAAHTESAGGFPWVALLGAVLGVFLVIGASIGLLVKGRRRKARPSVAPEPSALAWTPPLEPPPAAPVEPPPPAAPVPTENMICPTCRQGYPPGTRVCAKDGTQLITYASFAAQPVAELVCPKCGDSFPAGTRFCGKDGTTLG